MPSTITRTLSPGMRRICRTLDRVPTVYRSSRSGRSTVMSFWPTRNTGSPAAMAASIALMEAARPTSKWISTLGNTVSPRSAMAGRVWMLATGSWSMFVTSSLGIKSKSREARTG